jgi:hypothetical protein
MDLLQFLGETGNENDVTFQFVGSTSNGNNGTVLICLGNKNDAILTM